jgi:hypothetical protein
VTKLQATAAEIRLQTRAAQGLPERLTDDSVFTLVASLMRTEAGGAVA